jgi:hypothetical protein
MLDVEQTAGLTHGVDPATATVSQYLGGLRFLSGAIGGLRQYGGRTHSRSQNDTSESD